MRRDKGQIVANNNKYRWVPLAPGLAVNQASAAPIEGEIASNAAMLLILLGVWALFMGMRNLRELRYKRYARGRGQAPAAATTPAEED